MDKYPSFTSNQEKYDYLKVWMPKLFTHLPESMAFILGEAIRSSPIDNTNKDMLLELDKECILAGYNGSGTYFLVDELRRNGYIRYAGGIQIELTEKGKSLRKGNISYERDEGKNLPNQNSTKNNVVINNINSTNSKTNIDSTVFEDGSKNGKDSREVIGQNYFLRAWKLISENPLISSIISLIIGTLILGYLKIR